MKTLLKNPVYVGRPAIPEQWVEDLHYDNVVEDDDLAIIDDDIFEKTQTIIEQIAQKNSTDSDTWDIDDFVEEFDMFSVVASSDPVMLRHDCGSPMIKNGQRELSGDLKTHRYYCPDCDEYRQWPREYERRRMELIHLLLDDEVSFLEALNKVVTGYLEW